MSPLMWAIIAAVTLIAASTTTCAERSLRSASRSAMAQLLGARGRRRARRARVVANGNNNGNGAEASEPSEQAADPTPAWIRKALDEPEPAAAALALINLLLVSLGVLSLLMAVRGWRGVGEAGWPDVLITAAAGGPIVWLLLAALPLAVAERAPERALLALSWLPRAAGAVLGPAVGVQRLLSEVVRRLAGVGEVDDAEEREAEILTLLEESHFEGSIDDSAREMIEAVVEFRTTSVEQIMTPRTELEALEYTDDLEEIKRFAERAGHSRLPVYEESLDHIVGVLYAKDLLRWLVSESADSARFSLREVLREATFVPETKTVRELLAELLEQKVHIAFATDEYGGTAGIVTIEDIVEEVFGEIRDEYDREEHDDDRVRLDDAHESAEIDARAEIGEANAALDAIGIELPEHDDYDTVGGFVVTTMGKIPEKGEELRAGGLVLTVLEAEPTRVTRIRVERTADEEEPVA